MEFGIVTPAASTVALAACTVCFAQQHERHFAAFAESGLDRAALGPKSAVVDLISSPGCAPRIEDYLSAGSMTCVCAGHTRTDIASGVNRASAGK